jgi:hypothetical protein
MSTSRLASSFPTGPLVDSDWSAASRLLGPLSKNGVTSSVLLLSMGAIAAAASLIEMKWQIPGNSIIRPVLPYVLGLALVPRRWSGMTMTVGSIAGLAGMRALGFQKGLGGMTSLLLLGPALDLALLHARPNWYLYLRFALAGLFANGLAFAVQVMAKSYGLSLGGGRDFKTWFSWATISYPLFGLIAGLAAGLLLFHWRPFRDRTRRDNADTQGISP